MPLWSCSMTFRADRQAEAHAADLAGAEQIDAVAHGVAAHAAAIVRDDNLREVLRLPLDGDERCVPGGQQLRRPPWRW